MRQVVEQALSSLSIQSDIIKNPEAIHQTVCDTLDTLSVSYTGDAVFATTLDNAFSQFLGDEVPTA